MTDADDFIDEDDDVEETVSTQTDDKQQGTAEAVEQTHNTLVSHHDHSSKNKYAPTYDELKKDAEFVQEQIENLQQTISENTPEDPAPEVMQQDRTNTDTAMNNLDNGADPISTYEQQATVSTRPQSRKVTHDKYTIEEGKNSTHVEYEVTTRNTGGKATAMNDPNAVIGAHRHTQTYSYHEQKSGKNTTIETQYTTENNRAPDSANVTLGNNFPSGFNNTYSNTYTYDGDKRLTSSETTSSNSYAIDKSIHRAHKGKDLSVSQETTDIKTLSNIHGDREKVRFEYLETEKNGNIKTSITAELYAKETVYTSGYSLPVEIYRQQKGNQYTYVSRDKNDKGETSYSGFTATITGPKNEIPLDPEQFTNMQDMSPKDAEKTYRKLQKETNKRVKDLTGKHSLQEYRQDVPEAQQHHNLGAMFDNNSTPEAAETTRKNNEAFNSEFANTPAVTIETDDNKKKQTTTLTTEELMLMRRNQASR